MMGAAAGSECLALVRAVIAIAAACHLGVAQQPEQDDRWDGVQVIQAASVMHSDYAAVNGHMVRDILPRADGEVWAASTMGLLRYDSLSWTRVPWPRVATDSLAPGAASIRRSSREVLSLAEVDGELFVASRQAVWRWLGEGHDSGSRWQLLEIGPPPRNGWIRTLEHTAAGLLATIDPQAEEPGAWTGFAILDPQSGWRPYPVVEGIRGCESHIDADGIVWAVGDTSILRLQAGGTQWELDAAIEPPADWEASEVADRALDHDVVRTLSGDLYAALAGVLVHRGSGGQWIPVGGKPNRMTRPILLPDAQGTMRALSRGKHLLHFKVVDDRWAYEGAMMNRLDYMSAARIGPAGRIWFCGESCIGYLVSDPEWTRVTARMRPMAAFAGGFLGRQGDGLFVVTGSEKSHWKLVAPASTQLELDRQGRPWLLLDGRWQRLGLAGDAPVLHAGAAVLPDRQVRILGAAGSSGVLFAQPTSDGAWQVQSTDPASHDGEPGPWRLEQEPLAAFAAGDIPWMVLCRGNYEVTLLQLRNGDRVAPPLSDELFARDSGLPHLHRDLDGSWWVIGEMGIARYRTDGLREWSQAPILRPAATRAVVDIPAEPSLGGEPALVVVRDSSVGQAELFSCRGPLLSSTRERFSRYLGPAPNGRHMVSQVDGLRVTDFQLGGYRQTIRIPVNGRPPEAAVQGEDGVCFVLYATQLARFDSHQVVPRAFLDHAVDEWAPGADRILRLPVRATIPGLPPEHPFCDVQLQWRLGEGSWSLPVDASEPLEIRDPPSGKSIIEVRARAGWGGMQPDPLRIPIRVPSRIADYWQEVSLLVTLLLGGLLLWSWSRGAAQRVEVLQQQVQARDQRLATAERQRHELLDSLPLALFATDPDGRVIETNPVFQQLFAGAPERLSGMHWHQLLSVPEQVEAAESWTRAVQAPALFSRDCKLETTGGTRDVVFQLRPVLAGQGGGESGPPSLQGWQGCILDGGRLLDLSASIERLAAGRDELVALGISVLVRDDLNIWDGVVARIRAMFGLDGVSILELNAENTLQPMISVGEPSPRVVHSLLRRITTGHSDGHSGWWPVPDPGTAEVKWHGLAMHSRGEVLGLLLVQSGPRAPERPGRFLQLLGEVLGAGILKQRASAIVAGRDSALQEVGGLASMTSWSYLPESDDFIISRTSTALLGIEGWEGSHRDFVDRFIYVEDREAVREALHGVSIDHRPRRYDHRLVVPDGGIRHRRNWASWVPFPEGGGLVTGVTVDVTEEVMVAQRNRHLLAALQVADDGIAVTDPEGRIEYANHSLVRSLGQDMDSLVGASLADVLATAGVADFEGSDLLAGRPWRSAPFAVVKPERSVGQAVLQVGVTPLLENDKPAGSVAMFRDVGPETAMERRIQAMRRRAALGELARTVAHDMNNVLLAIRNRAVQLQADDLGPEDQAAFTQRILESCDRGSEMTRRIVESGRMPRFTAEPVDVGAFLAGLRPLLAGVLGPQARLRVTVEDGIGEWPLDRYLIEHALLNLCANSRDALQGRGLVTVWATLDGGGDVDKRQILVLSVEDDGEGMDAETLARCQEPFFTTKEPSQGTGLGLAGVVETVRKHGGSLRVESSPGRGTRVEMTFPEHASRSAVAPRKEWRDLEEVGLALVVDDDPVAREAGSVQLRRHGYRVLQAQNIAGALAIAEANPVLELAVLDINLGGEDGRELARLLRELDPELPVVLCSGDPDSLASVRHEQDAVARLAKPYVSEVFSAAVLSALTRIQRRVIPAMPPSGQRRQPMAGESTGGGGMADDAAPRTTDQAT